MMFCIDSQILIWGIKKQSSDGQEDMIKRAEHFFRWVDKEKHDILIPTVVIAEILAPEPKEKYSEYMDQINENFMIGEFNTMCAIRYADLLYGKFGDLKQLMHNNGIRKEKMKADFMVLATALAYKAKTLYTNDQGLLKIAKGHIQVANIPELPPEQLELFDQNI